MNTFWQVFIRIVVITAIVFAIYNPFGYSLYHLESYLIGTYATEGWFSTEYIAALLIAVITLAVGAYILGKAWQGVGRSYIKAAILPVIFGLMFALLYKLEWLTSFSTPLIVALEFVIGLVVGLQYSMTLIDRRLSGTVTAAIAGDDVDHHHGTI